MDEPVDERKQKAALKEATLPDTDDAGASNFPVMWEDPSDAELEWSWDDMHFPQALTNLTGDYLMDVLYQGVNQWYEYAGLPMRICARIVNGFAYDAYKPHIPEEEKPA